MVNIRFITDETSWKAPCHKGNQKDHHWILRFFHLKITDKQHSDYYHCHMDHQKEIFPASSSQQIKERKDDRHRSDWQTLVIVTKLGGLVLSLLFHYVKVTQTDYRSYTIQAENDHTRNMVLPDNNRSLPETHQNIPHHTGNRSEFQISSHPLYGSSLYGQIFPSNISQSPDSARHKIATLKSPSSALVIPNTETAETDVCKHHRIIIKSKHILFLLFQTFFLHCS